MENKKVTTTNIDVPDCQTSLYSSLLPKNHSLVTPFWSPNQSYLDITRRCLTSLCDSVGFSAVRRDECIKLVEFVLGSWAKERIGTQPCGLSDISDEHFPIEFSLTLEDGVPEVRILFESQAQEFRQDLLWQAGWETSKRFEQCGADLKRLHLVADLFEPTHPSSRYAMWHSLAFSPTDPPQFKVYLNPKAQGSNRALEIIREALTRLGFSHTVQDVFSNITGNQVCFFSLDLCKGADARIKVYLAYPNATKDEISTCLQNVPTYSPDLLNSFWQVIAGSKKRFCQLPVIVYLSFNSHSDRPTSGKVDFPIRSYAKDDDEVYQRVLSFLNGRDRELYQHALSNFATRPLEAGVGLHSYVSLRVHSGLQHTTVYLSPEVYQIHPPQNALFN